MNYTIYRIEEIALECDISGCNNIVNYDNPLTKRERASKSKMMEFAQEPDQGEYISGVRTGWSIANNGQVLCPDHSSKDGK